MISMKLYQFCLNNSSLFKYCPQTKFYDIHSNEIYDSLYVHYSYTYVRKYKIYDYFLLLRIKLAFHE